jgi:hypothetical protein
MIPYGSGFATKVFINRYLKKTSFEFAVCIRAISNTQYRYRTSQAIKNNFRSFDLISKISCSQMPIQFANLLFANMTFRQFDLSPIYNSPTLHFTNMTNREHNISPKWQFANMTNRQHDISPTLHFTNMTICQHEISPTWQFANMTFHQHYISPTWQFANMTFRQHDNSPTWHFTNITIHQHDNSPTWHFTNMTICQHDISPTWKELNWISKLANCMGICSHLSHFVKRYAGLECSSLQSC